MVLKETPVKTIERIKNNKLSPQLLKPVPRQEIAEYLDASGWSEVNIAAFLQVHRNTVSRDLKKVHQLQGELLLKTNFEHILGHLVKVKKQVQSKLSGQKKWKDVWTVEKEFLEKIQSLGVMFKQPDEVVVTDERKQYLGMYANMSSEQVNNRIGELEAFESGQFN